jgi:hypothetical protein
MGTGTGNRNALLGGQHSRERLGRADALEAAAVRAYRCRRELATVVLDAERRAAAAARLDAVLRHAVAA